MKKSIWIGLGAIVVVIVIIFATTRGGEQKDQGPMLVSMTDGNNTVAVSDQDPGTSVNIPMAVLVNPGYVVVHEDTDGAPGEDIGVSQLLIGSNENVVVTLTRVSVSGETLHAMLHTDDGDGLYTFPGPDVPLTDSNDEIIVVPFEILSVEQIDGQTEDEIQEPDQTDPVTDNESDSQDSGEVANHVVSFDGSDYSPSTLTINQGDSVTFRNDSTTMTWPATAFHPTHTVYPGSDISKCGTAEAGSIFDACGRLGQGETYTFTFDEVGSWKYHDHLSPSKNGTINVE